MKKLLLILFFFPLISNAQSTVNCSLLDVTDVVIDNTNMTIDIEIFDGNSLGMQYPFVAYVIDALGDTIQNGNINLFGTMGLDTSWYNYPISNSITPFYPLTLYFVHSNFSGTNPGQDTCVLSYHPSCDSISINFNNIDTNIIPNLLAFDVQTFGLDNGNFGYGGFILINELGDTIAFENINNAGNVFGLMPYTLENRMLDVIQTPSLPFSGFLHLITGWFAGNPITSCVFPFEISIVSSDINEVFNKRKVIVVKDLLGRETTVIKNTFLFFIYDDGKVEKRITIE